MWNGEVFGDGGELVGEIYCNGVIDYFVEKYESIVCSALFKASPSECLYHGGNIQMGEKLHTHHRPLRALVNMYMKNKGGVSLPRVGDMYKKTQK